MFNNYFISEIHVMLQISCWFQSFQTKTRTKQKKALTSYIKNVCDYKNYL